MSGKEKKEERHCRGEAYLIPIGTFKYESVSRKKSRMTRMTRMSLERRMRDLRSAIAGRVEPCKTGGYLKVARMTEERSRVMIGQVMLVLAVCRRHSSLHKVPFENGIQGKTAAPHQLDEEQATEVIGREGRGTINELHTSQLSTRT
jgi:hypothetical protein